VVQESIRLLDNEDADIGLLVQTISKDQVISARVLRLANSSYYGVARNIKTLNDAVALVGIKALRTMILASGITAAFASVPNFDLKRFWRHNLITASIARAVASDRHLNAEAAYVSGLMHSIGQIMIHQVFPQAGADIDAICHGSSVLERKAVENSSLGIDHCQIGAELAKRWDFPEEIQHAIRYYADPLHPLACSLAPLIYVAGHIAFGLAQRQASEHIASTLNAEIAAKMGIILGDAANPDLEALIAKIASFTPYVLEAESFV
jgi:putative nucleotidyltransferase with HDIG domain